MRARLAAATLAVVVAGCGGDSRDPAMADPAVDASQPDIDAPAPNGTQRGRAVASQAGCLGCHRLAGEGNDGPGGDLTHVGSHLDRDQIKQALVSPPPPMPSYRDLPPSDFRALVDYLSALR